MIPERPTFVVRILEEDYEAFVALFKHRIGFPPTYAGWRERTLQQVANLQKHRRLFKEVTIKPDKFVAWCRASGMNPEFEYLDTFAVYAERGRK